MDNGSNKCSPEVRILVTKWTINEGRGVPLIHRGEPMPSVLDAHQTAEVFGVSYWTLLDTVKAGTCPVEPLRLGRRLVWPTAKVLRALGLDEGEGHGEPSD